MFVIDAEHRFGLRWNESTETFLFVETIAPPNGIALELSDLWEKLDQRLEN